MKLSGVMEYGARATMSPFQRLRLSLTNLTLISTILRMRVGTPKMTRKQSKQLERLRCKDDLLLRLLQ